MSTDTNSEPPAREVPKDTCTAWVGHQFDRRYRPATSWGQALVAGRDGVTQKCKASGNTQCAKDQCLLRGDKPWIDSGKCYADEQGIQGPSRRLVGRKPRPN